MAGMAGKSLRNELERPLVKAWLHGLAGTDIGLVLGQRLIGPWLAELVY
jgi:hypothetical protein